MQTANTTGADSRFPGPAHPPRFAELPLHQLHVSGANVRAHGADQDLDGLVANIRAHGLIQPLVVRRREVPYPRPARMQRNLPGGRAPGFAPGTRSGTTTMTVAPPCPPGTPRSRGEFRSKFR